MYSNGIDFAKYLSRQLPTDQLRVIVVAGQFPLLRLSKLLRPLQPRLSDRVDVVRTVLFSLVPRSLDLGPLSQKLVHACVCARLCDAIYDSIIPGKLARVL